MGQYIPKINLPLEGVEHARWLERRSVEQAAAIEQLRIAVAKAGKETSAGARQTTLVNVNSQQTAAVLATTNGLPVGGTDGQILSKVGTKDGAATWADPGVAVVEFTLPFTNMADSVTRWDLEGTFFEQHVGYNSAGSYWYADFTTVKEPLLIALTLAPTFNGEKFDLWLPNAVTGKNPPFVQLSIKNDSPGGFYGDFRHNTSGVFYHDALDIPLMGQFVGSTRISLQDGFQASWFLLSTYPEQYVAIVNPDADDEYYELNVRQRRRCFTWTIPGALTTGVGGLRIYNDTPTSLTISDVRVSVGTAPTGAALIADVNVGGSTIFTTPANRPTIAASANTGVGVPDVTDWPNTDYVTIDIDQVGSTVAGSDLTVQVWAG